MQHSITRTSRVHVLMPNNARVHVLMVMFFWPCFDCMAWATIVHLLEMWRMWFQQVVASNRVAKRKRDRQLDQLRALLIVLDNYYKSKQRAVVIGHY